ncbi:MAG: hypothetical protein QF915_04365 [Candidatus Woesearchaeota archaeon]|nr:hypothetical protein [Candidatus Woesearchaeota archaeon]
MQSGALPLASITMARKKEVNKSGKKLARPIRVEGDISRGKGIGHKIFGSREKDFYHDDFAFDKRHYGVYILMIIIIVPTLAYIINPSPDSAPNARVSGTEQLVVKNTIGEAYNIILEDNEPDTRSWPIALLIFSLVGFVLGTFVYLHHQQRYHKKHGVKDKE